jgi:hypothetical protein
MSVNFESIHVGSYFVIQVAHLGFRLEGSVL